MLRWCWPRSRSSGESSPAGMYALDAAGPHGQACALISFKEFAVVDTSSYHVQQVNDLELLHVSTGTPEEDIKMWRKVYVGENPLAYRWPDLWEALCAGNCAFSGAVCAATSPASTGSV